jgi:hypothetical protein
LAEAGAYSSSGDSNERNQSLTWLLVDDDDSSLICLRLSVVNPNTCPGGIDSVSQFRRAKSRRAEVDFLGPTDPGLMTKIE